MQKSKGVFTDISRFVVEQMIHSSSLTGSTMYSYCKWQCHRVTLLLNESFSLHHWHFMPISIQNRVTSECSVIFSRCAFSKMQGTLCYLSTLTPISQNLMSTRPSTELPMYHQTFSNLWVIVLISSYSRNILDKYIWLLLII